MGTGETTKYQVSDTDTATGSDLFEKLFPDEQEKKEEFINEMYNLGQESSEALLKGITDAAGFNGTFDSYYKSLTTGEQSFLKDFIGSISPDTQAVLDLADILNTTFTKAIDIVEGSGVSADLINSLFSQIKDAGVDINTEEVQEGLLSALSSFSKNVPTTTEEVTDFVEALKSIGVSGLQAVDILYQLSDASIGLRDVDSTLRNMRSVVSDVNEINSAISDSTITYEQLYNLLSSYPEQADVITECLLNEGQINEAVAKQMYETNKQQLMKELQLNIDNLTARRNANIALATGLGKVADAITAGDFSAAQSQLDGYLTSYEQRANAYQAMAQFISNTNKDLADDGEMTSVADLNLDDYRENITNKNKDAATAAILAAQKQLLAEADLLDTRINAYKILQQNYKNDTWKPAGGINLAFDNAAGSASKAANATKDATEAAEEYERQLDEIYAATQRLEGISSKLDFIDSLKELYDDRQGEEYRYLLEKQTENLEKQTDAYKKLIQAQLNERESLLEGVEPAVRDVFELVDGRLVPVMSKYNKLNDAQAESADELADAFNDLTDDIIDNTNSIIENESALKELEEERRDMVIETQEILIEAIRAEQEAIYEEKQAALEKEKELLEQRKQMYSDAFSEEDYTNELGDMTAQRQNIINQLAQLEGASDSESKRKRAELLEELTQLNQQYNDTITEYNRDALLTQIDDEISANETLQEELENDYNERIEDYAWLQEQIKNLTSQGVDACMEYLKT